MPTVGVVAGVTLVIWPFDHDPPHVHAYEGTPNTPSARRSRFEIATGNVIDKPASAGLSAAKARQIRELDRRAPRRASSKMAAATAVIPDPAPPIAAIAVRPGHVVRVFFKDGEVREVDLTHTLDRPPFSALRDPGTFAKAHIGQITGGLEWTDEIGLDPDVIYAGLDLGPRAPRIRALVTAG